jgi:predicted esterase
MKAQIVQHAFEVKKTARFFILGPDDPIGRLWALHGYGQLPQYFLRRFQSAADAGWQVIAPEGLHRFYLQGTDGRIGASWMTREEREADMFDYVRYLDDLKSHMNPLEGPNVLLGFSQGVATAARWACRGNVAFDAHVFWAGVFPPDLDAFTELAELRKAPSFVVLGDQDPYFQNDLISETTDLFERAQLEFRTVHFQGGHEISPGTLDHILQQLA